MKSCGPFSASTEAHCAIDDGFEVVKILMSAYMSAEKGQTVELPAPGLESFVPAVAKGNWNP